MSNCYFIELRLVFGAVSSPALFYRPNWLITEAALRKTGFPRSQLVKQLDDLCCVASKDERALMDSFVGTYRSMCSTVGIRLAPDDNTDKRESFYICCGRHNLASGAQN